MSFITTTVGLPEFVYDKPFSFMMYENEKTIGIYYVQEAPKNAQAVANIV